MPREGDAGFRKEMKVLLATQKPFSAEAVAGIRDIVAGAGAELAILEGYESAGELKNAVVDADALIVRSDKVDASVIAAAPGLRIIVRAGAGYDNIDLDAASARRIVVMNTPGQNANAVAELALAMMLYAARNQFTPASGSEISGKTLGVLAFGNVGALVGAKARALGMKVRAYDPFLSAERIEAAGAESVGSIEELFASSDYLSLHIPATPQTVGSIGYSLVSSLPAGATLVNTARKEVVDEAGLLKALGERTDLKYVTDVAPDNLEELRKVAGLRVFATPKKMGAQTAEANLNAGLAAARQIAAFFADGCTRFQVNKF